MANLRVDKITSTETFETTGSVQFDGSGDGLRTDTSSDLTLGTGAFTIECWFLRNNVTDSWGVLVADNLYQSAGGWSLYTQYDDIRFYKGGAQIFEVLNCYSAQTWTHIAVQRDSSGNFSCYINGVDQGVSANDSIDFTDNRICIGTNNYSSGYPNQYNYNGFISNVRIIKGTAFYTANFKPSMRELEVTPETVLLACQSKTDAILEKTGKTLTADGNAVANELTPGILTPVPKAGAGSAITGSVEFDGNKDYLSVQSSTDFDFGTGDFTIELYANLGNLTNRNIFARNDSNPSNTGILLWHNGSGQLEWQSSVGNSTGVITVTTPLTLHEWAHIAVSRKSNTTRLFANGVLIGSTSDNTDISGDSVLNIGSTFAGTLYYVKGFISNLRMVKGTALYTDSFIPPTRELKKVPGTVLLCCQDPDSPLTEATGKTITGYGDLSPGGGSNLVSNAYDADAPGDTTGWSTDQGASLSVSSGRLRVTNGISDYGIAQTSVTTITGQRYVARADFHPGTANQGELRASNTLFSNTLGGTGLNALSPKSLTFTAASTTTYINVYGSNTSGEYSEWANFSVTLAEGSNKGSNFTPQVGDDRKVTFEGATKVNSDAYFYLPTGDTVTRDSRSGRGVLGGGQNPGNVGTIDFVTIQSMGNSLDFGDLNQTGQQAGCSSSTRGLFANGSNNNTIDFITIPTTGNALDFGDRTVSLNGVGALSSNTRGVFLGGGSPAPQSDVMDYVTIASTGDAIDFGNLTTANKNPAGCSSPVRGVIAMGGSPAEVNTIDFITIASTGNSLDFGDCTEVGEGRSAFSSSIRGIFTGSYSTPAVIDVIQYVTISSKGNATDFGNLVLARTEGAGTSDSIRGLSFGGFTPGSPVTPQNIIDYVTITTTGNAKDFGDLTQARQYPGACSDSHGGLG
jgi:hypothetical protein